MKYRVAFIDDFRERLEKRSLAGILLRICMVLSPLYESPSTCIPGHSYSEAGSPSPLFMIATVRTTPMPSRVHLSRACFLEFEMRRSGYLLDPRTIKNHAYAKLVFRKLSLADPPKCAISPVLVLVYLPHTHNNLYRPRQILAIVDFFTP